MCVGLCALTVLALEGGMEGAHCSAEAAQFAFVSGPFGPFSFPSMGGGCRDNGQVAAALEALEAAARSSSREANLMTLAVQVRGKHVYSCLRLHLLARWLAARCA